MLYVHRTGIAHRESIASLRARPEHRKSTDQMLLALAAASTCLEGCVERETLGLVVGSGQGEFETTKEYYKAYAREGVARPFLFQNSLHHSTAGMLSLALKIRGAAASVSDHYFSGESALDLAQSFLESGQCTACVVVGVDTLVPEFDVGIRARYPAGLIRGEGAAAVLVSLSAAGASFSIESMRRVPGHAERADLRGYYDADGIESLLRAHASSVAVRADKPDGAATEFSIRRLS